MTRGTISRINLNQWAVVRNNRCMGRFPTAGMTIGTVAGNNSWQQIRNGVGMAEITITHMSDGDRRVRSDAWIVTGQTGGGAANMTERHMINIQVNGQLFVGVTWQTVSRIGTGCNGVDDFLTRAVMTGRTGPGAVGGNIVHATFDLRPGGNRMTVATWLTRCIEGEIAGTLGNGMTMGRVECIKTGGVTAGAIAWDCLPCCNALQGAGGGVVTAGAVGMGLGGGADQGVIVTTGTVGGANSNNPAVIPRR